MRKILGIMVIAGFVALGIAKPTMPPTEAEQAQQAEQAALKEQRQACEARPNMVWGTYDHKCEKACDYECVQHYKDMRKLDNALTDAMNPWKE
jgi:hypothetical protein